MVGLADDGPDGGNNKTKVGGRLTSTQAVGERRILHATQAEHFSWEYWRWGLSWGVQEFGYNQSRYMFKAVSAWKLQPCTQPG